MQLKALALTRHEFGESFDLVAGMHRLRARVFKNRLDWDVSVAGDMEIDLYDAEDATYLLIVSDKNEVVGHTRLLPTLGPNMLADTFSILLGPRLPPRSPWIAEASRFCVDTSRATDLTKSGMRQATSLLLATVVEWSLQHNYRAVATVTDTRMERLLRRAGWRLKRLGAPCMIGSVEAVAGVLPVTGDILRTLCDFAGLSPPVLTAGEPLRRAA